MSSSETFIAYPMGSQPPALPRDEAHVWLLDWEAQDAGMLQLLTRDERARADRFHFPNDRLRYGITRASLRRLLSGYLSVALGDLHFEYSAEGKPSLPSSLTTSADPVQFNVSHSGRFALLAFVRGNPLGVDVEAIREEVLAENLAERFFSLDEQAVLRALPRPQQLKAFFHCWTRKEAYLKALGEGLVRGLDTFSVVFNPTQPAGLRSDALDPSAPGVWRIVDLPVPEGYAGALTVSRAVNRIQMWLYS